MRIMKILVDYLRNAYYHCLHYVVSKQVHIVERVFWILCTLLSMIGALYVVHESLKSLDRKSTFSVNTNYLSFRTPFPSVIICQKSLSNIDPVYNMGRKLFNVDLSENEAEFIKALSFFVPFDTAGLEDAGGCVANAKSNILHKTDNFNETMCPATKKLFYDLRFYRSLLEATCSTILTYCEYNGRPFNCCEKFRPIPSFSGTCYAINSYVSHVLKGNFTKYEDMTGKTGWSDQKDGLDFFIELKNGKNPAKLTVEVAVPVLVFYASPYDVATRMFIKSPDTHLESTEENSSNFIKIYLRIEEVVADNSIIGIRSPEKRGCRLWSEYSSSSLVPFFSPSTCELDCIKKLQYESCNCSSHGLPKKINDTIPECDYFGLACLADQTRVGKYLPMKLDECSSKCDSNCFNLKIFKVGLLTSRKFDAHRTFQNPRSNRSISIFVASPYIQYERHVFKESLDFMVSVGGAISLFIGSSYLSIGQLFYYFIIKPISDRIRNKKQKKLRVKEQTMREAFFKQNQKIRNAVLEETIRRRMVQKMMTKNQRISEY